MDITDDGLKPEIIKDVNRVMRTNKELKEEYDKDFPVMFCPVCGSYHTHGSGHTSKLFNDIEWWQDTCSSCGWEFEIFITKRGKEPKKFRYDDVDCKECTKYRKDIGVS